MTHHGLVGWGKCLDRATSSISPRLEAALMRGLCLPYERPHEHVKHTGDQSETNAVILGLDYHIVPLPLSRQADLTSGVCYLAALFRRLARICPSRMGSASRNTGSTGRETIKA